MVTCNECIHYEPCKSLIEHCNRLAEGSYQIHFPLSAGIGKKICKNFIDKSLILEIPCNVGDKIYQTDGVEIYESTINEVTLTANRFIYVTENIVFDERAIDVSIFLTRDQAEMKLRERADNDT